MVRDTAFPVVVPRTRCTASRLLLAVCQAVCQAARGAVSKRCADAIRNHAQAT